MFSLVQKMKKKPASESMVARVALITGAGSGIGKATALLMARHGLVVGLLGNVEADLTQVSEEIHALGGRTLILLCDVRDECAMKSSIDRLAQECGRIDIVFANAGINGVRAPLECLTPDEWDFVMQVNLRGAFLAAKYAIPYLKKGGGSIIFNASVKGSRVFCQMGYAAYSSGKAALIALAKTLALELAEHRIRVNVICPGPIDGTQINAKHAEHDMDRLFPAGETTHPGPLLTRGKFGTPLDVAQAVFFLSSDAASFVTGTEFFIDGGFSLV
jgi:NAD(P)-dependent dehydrogenase (short-subunit alcohol dehydrogenase family)